MSQYVRKLGRKQYKGFLGLWNPIADDKKKKRKSQATLHRAATIIILKNSSGKRKLQSARSLFLMFWALFIPCIFLLS